MTFCDLSVLYYVSSSRRAYFLRFVATDIWGDCFLHGIYTVPDWAGKVGRVLVAPVDGFLGSILRRPVEFNLHRAMRGVSSRISVSRAMSSVCMSLHEFQHAVAQKGYAIGLLRPFGFAGVGLCF